MATLLVNNEVIEEAAIRLETAAMLKLIAARMPAEDPLVLRTRAGEWAEENLIEAALLRQEASRDPEPVQTPPGCSPEAEIELRIERLVSRIRSQAARPRHKDIVAFYLKNRDSFFEPEKVRAAHIVKNVEERSHDNSAETSARAAIERARDELAQGRPFSEIADEMSDCAGQGGDLGFFGRGDMVPAFEDVVFRMPRNEVSDIFRSEFGFHIATVLERRAAGIRSLEEVHDRIEAHLWEEKKQKRLHQYVDHLRARAVIRREEALAR